MNKFIATLSLGAVSMLATAGAQAGEACCKSKDATSVVKTSACEEATSCSAKSVEEVKNSADCAGKTECSAEKTSCSSSEKTACSTEVKNEKIVMQLDDKSIVSVDYDQSEEASSTYTLGSKVSDFNAVLAQSGEEKSLSSLTGDKGTVIVFWNQECPYVTGANGADKAILSFAKEYADKGISVVAIDAGVNNSEESITAYSKDISIPVLVNRDSSLAAKFNAKYTPHTFVLDANNTLVYAGAFHTGNGDKVRSHAQNAVDDVLAGNEPVVKEAKGVGCSIKWAPGSRPNT